MKRAGQVVLFNFPQTDFASSKIRPALLLARLPGGYDDWLICMISSQMHQYIDGLDDIIRPDTDDFGQSGLKAECVFRVSRIAVATDDVLEGTIGEISQERLRRIRDNLARWIKSDEESKEDELSSVGNTLRL